MMQLHQDFEKFQEKNTVVVAIGPENAAAFKRFFEENDLEFYGIPDPTMKVLKLYGQKVNLFKLGRMPAQMLVDREGILRFVHYGHSMQDIPESQALFELLDKM